MAYTSQNQSVAAFVAADKVAFYHCGFYSTHNTLFDYKGRHYYDSCYIQGSIDFIFGRGRSVFRVTFLPFFLWNLVIFDEILASLKAVLLVLLQSCEMFVIDDKRLKVRGSITAQNRESADEKSGFVFLKGKVYGIGGVYLGRAKGAYSRVIFAKTYLSMTVLRDGWTNWSYHGSTE